MRPLKNVIDDLKRYIVTPSPRLWRLLDSVLEQDNDTRNEEIEQIIGEIEVVTREEVKSCCGELRMHLVQLNFGRLTNDDRQRLLEQLQAEIDKAI